MDLSEEWGELNLDLDGTTDAEWARRKIALLREDGVPEAGIWVNPEPVSRREFWVHFVRGKRRRLGWKFDPEVWATRFRKREREMGEERDSCLISRSSEGIEVEGGKEG